jgi:hypothetical protein
MSVKLGYFARAAYRAFTTAKNGPTLYDLCDPLLGGPGEGDAHLRRFYKKALANPMLRLLLSRAGRRDSVRSREKIPPFVAAHRKPHHCLEPRQATSSCHESHEFWLLYRLD